MPWFRKKPVIVEGILWRGDNVTVVEEFCDDLFRPVKDPRRPGMTGKIYDKLHDTWVFVKTGQWIIRGVKGELYPCDDEVMEQTYDGIDEVEADKYFERMRGH